MEPRTAAGHGAYAAVEILSMAEEPLVLISDKLSSDIGHLQTKPRHREGYGVWVTQNSPAKRKKRPLNFQESDTPGKAGGLMSRAASKAVDLTTGVFANAC